MPRLVASLVSLGLAASVQGADLSITQCATGAASLITDEFKGAVVQVCNLFGAACVVNHPQIASDSCATEALTIADKECKIYPLREFTGHDRTVAANEELSTYGDYGYYATNTKVSGSSLAVQCTLSGDTKAGPAFPGGGVSTWNSFYATSGGRVAVTDTAAAGAMNPVTFAYIPAKAKQSKTVFLVRTGNYVGTSDILKKSSSGTAWKVGALPTLGEATANYGPVACPSTGQKLTSLNTATTAMTAAQTRMCGSTSKWNYWGGANFLMDKPLQVGLSKDSTGTTAQRQAKHLAGTATTTLDAVGTPKFLMSEEKYKSTQSMDDPRKLCIKGGTSGACILTSDTITPSNPSGTHDLACGAGTFSGTTQTCWAGQWRYFGVAFYCEDYARTDLTTCAEGKRKMFYVSEPAPDALYGTSGADIQGVVRGSGGSAPAGATTSGSARAVASLAVIVLGAAAATAIF